MIRFSATTNGDVESALKEFDRAVYAIAVFPTAAEIVKDIQGGGPHPAPIETGDLRASYFVEGFPEEVAAEVKNDMGVADYAIPVELGHVNALTGGFVAPQPHALPATEAQQPEFERRIIQAIESVFGGA